MCLIQQGSTICCLYKVAILDFEHKGGIGKSDIISMEIITSKIFVIIGKQEWISGARYGKIFNWGTN